MQRKVFRCQPCRRRSGLGKGGCTTRTAMSRPEESPNARSAASTSLAVQPPTLAKPSKQATCRGLLLPPTTKPPAMVSSNARLLDPLGAPRRYELCWVLGILRTTATRAAKGVSLPAMSSPVWPGQGWLHDAYRSCRAQRNPGQRTHLQHPWAHHGGSELCWPLGNPENNSNTCSERCFVASPVVAGLAWAGWPHNSYQALSLPRGISSNARLLDPLGAPRRYELCWVLGNLRTTATRAAKGVSLPAMSSLV